ncbi:uncharacterized protein L3040_002195 [Drepanopeziza brunnea f. sp. 'multigermtubi']|uniref:uncharacterized protein n=1 Tax=Drepanopeziza brunnea f. sp. 'multigermtubi' TaxID=698441 RepID=UPI00239FD042|nr:hypothetical protein L3040_002195 [Drepanopeziza brunnea f. sp. 'multigermtubi']
MLQSRARVVTPLPPLPPRRSIGAAADAADDEMGNGSGSAVLLVIVLVGNPRVSDGLLLLERKPKPPVLNGVVVLIRLFVFVERDELEKELELEELVNPVEVDIELFDNGSLEDAEDENDDEAEDTAIAELLLVVGKEAVEDAATDSGLGFTPLDTIWRRRSVSGA